MAEDLMVLLRRQARMNTDVKELELYRHRWRRVRRVLQLVDPDGESFAEGGLARFMPDLGARLLILPPDRRPCLWSSTMTSGNGGTNGGPTQ